MQNDGARKFNFRTHLISTISWLILAVGVFSALHSPVLAAWTNGERTVTVTAAADETTMGPAAIPAGTDLAPDTTDEGWDVLMLGYEQAPADLWQGLIDAGYHGTTSEWCKCLYVPVGTAVHVPTGMYLATLDGWAVCRAGQFHRVCSATGPVTMLNIPLQSTVQSDNHAAVQKPSPVHKATAHKTTTAHQRPAAQHKAAPHKATAHKAAPHKRPTASHAVPEDTPGWPCARSGNHVCGPHNPSGAPAGCYHAGALVIPWSHYELDQYGNASHDPLWAQLAPPC